MSKIFCWTIVALLPALAADAQPLKSEDPRLETHEMIFDSVATHRFVASHGRNAVLMGYPESGLEFLAYPLQIVSGYRIGFRPEGAATETDATPLLGRITASPERATRIYTGPDYVVRETLFVPLDRTAAIIRYEVESAHALDIVVHFTPVLDLLWPAALGGQSTRWNAAVPGYVMSEPAHGFAALIGSRQSVGHDATVNSTRGAEGKLAFAIRPRREPGQDAAAPATAKVVIAQFTAQTDPAAAMRRLEAEADSLETAAVAHYASLLRGALRLRTPDAAINTALAWTQVALDQAWVCNPQLGCGIVAGYGPSRSGRRPQYAWYFAGDGLLATEALTSAGAFARARDELEFVARYQDASSGMVWHELAQSSNYVDWPKYPYMFVHVDIASAYLNTVARYVAASGDADFAVRHWDSLAAAYRYCQSLIDATSHLPRIPAGKSGGDEQHSPSDDLGLSTSWAEAARNFADLARLSGHPDAADGAIAAAELARGAIAKRYWDSQHNFWIDGHDTHGAPIRSRGSGPGSAIGAGIFTSAQEQSLLDQIASANFQTDWGTRGIGSDSDIYAPWSYATGSIFAIHSTQSAQTFWRAHRPQVAWSIFRGVVPWSTLDAPGHLHEVLAGNYFRPQTESVPEQTWSSAGLLDAAVLGLFGIEVRAAQNALVLQPHMPAEWNEMSAENIHLPHATVAFTLQHDPRSVELDLRNDGEPVAVEFSPQIPLGADVVDAQCAGAVVAAAVASNTQDTHARLTFTAARGGTRCHVGLAGGVAVMFAAPAAGIGDPSTGIKATRLRLLGRELALDADVHARGDGRFRLQTPWKIQSVTGGSVVAQRDDVYEIEFNRAAARQADGYASRHIGVVFADP